MAWSTPLTAVANTALTAVQWNASVRDNLLETGPQKATTGGRLLVTTGANTVTERDVLSANIITGEITAVTTYTDLATVGPAVTLTTGAKALVAIGNYQWNFGASGRSWMSHAVSGASTQAASDTTAIMSTSSASNELYGYSQLTLWTTLTVGVNTFTAKYRATGGTGTFSTRRIAVMGL